MQVCVTTWVIRPWSVGSETGWRDRLVWCGAKGHRGYHRGGIGRGTPAGTGRSRRINSRCPRPSRAPFGLGEASSYHIGPLSRWVLPPGGNTPIVPKDSGGLLALGTAVCTQFEACRGTPEPDIYCRKCAKPRSNNAKPPLEASQKAFPEAPRGRPPVSPGRKRLRPAGHPAKNFRIPPPILPAHPRCHLFWPGELPHLDRGYPPAV